MKKFTSYSGNPFIFIRHNSIYFMMLIFFMGSCNNSGTRTTSHTVQDSAEKKHEYGMLDDLSSLSQSQSVTKFAKICGWENDRMPIPAKGYRVVKFAENLNSPRNIYIASNGDIFVSQARTEKTGEDIEKIDSRNQYRAKSPNQILRFRDKDKDGIPETQEVFLEGLNQPYGMLILHNYFYVANTDAVLRYAYDEATGKITGDPQTITALPAGGYNNHWTRNLTASPDGNKIYISVGSASNVGEYGMDKEINRAAILEINPDGSDEQLFASGLRNPVGMSIEPSTQQLWTVVNERDELGDELVPDYLTSVRKNGFYGWPNIYWGQYVDPRWKDNTADSLKNTAIKPDYAVGSHTASLGLAFAGQTQGFQKGAYIGQHGSWNRSELVGYKVVFVPFEKGKPSGKQQDVLTGFIADKNTGEVYGRPVAVAFTDRYLLVTDDAANMIWAVIPD